MMNSEIKQKFIREFFPRLGEKLNYCILRNYEKLPQEMGHDIDVLVDAKNESFLQTIVTPIVCALGWSVIVSHRYDDFISIVCVYIEGEIVETINVDFFYFGSFLWRGNQYIDEKAILKSAFRYGEYVVAGRGADIALTVTKQLMGEKHIGEKYREKIPTYAKADPQTFLEATKPLYGDFAQTMLEKCMDASLEQIEAMRNDLRARVRRENVGRYLKMSVHALNKRVKPFLHPNGKLIAFVGPDGSGKTTLLKLEMNYLSPLFDGGIKEYHYRYGIFPSLPTGSGIASMGGKIHDGMSNINVQDEKKTRASSRSIVSKLATWAAVAYYTLEYMIGNIQAARLVRTYSAIFFDRYYYDWFTEPTSRDLIWPFRRILLSLVRKPDLIVHLVASGEVVHARKPELSAEEIDIQNRYMSRILLGYCENSVDIHTDGQSANEVAADVFRIIVQRFYGTELGAQEQAIIECREGYM